MVLKNDTDAFEAWENPPAHIYMQFYFFNVTNPLEVLSGEKPAVVEVGPYTYRWAKHSRSQRKNRQIQQTLKSNHDQERKFRLTWAELNPHTEGGFKEKQV